MADPKTRSFDSLYQVISAIFCMIVVMSNLVAAKMLKLPFFADFSIPVGLLAYPFTFLISDFVTEIYGSKQSKLMVYTAFLTAILSYLMITIALSLPTSDMEYQYALQAALGLNGITIFSSLAAYLLAQILDIKLYAWIKQQTGQRYLWLRTNGSTLISQIADTLTVNLIFLYWGLGMELTSVCQIMLFSYCYKTFFSLATTPLFYLLVFFGRKETSTPTSVLKKYLYKPSNISTSTLSS